MMNHEPPDAISHPDQVTPEWLTAVLRRRALLPHGSVLGLSKKLGQSNNADSVRLDVHYSAEAPEHLPRRFFLKLTGRRIEVIFYRQIAPDMPVRHLLHCYDAAYNREREIGHLLLEDLSDTHFEPDEALPLPRSYGEACIDILAQLHAHWWEHPRLSSDIAVESEDVMGFVCEQARQALPAFVDFLGERLSARRQELFERLFAAWPLAIRSERLRSGRQVTLVHGDAHIWNFLYPRHSESETVRLIDWAVWHIDVGTNDLAYMMALHWYPDYRAQVERDLLRRYHRALLEGGVTGYDWDQCWQDYRISAMANLFWPIFDWAFDAPVNIWWHNLERAVLAWDDLDCEEFLT